MLKGIPQVLSPELLCALSQMGHGDELVIADGNRAVGLAGIMGGENSEIKDTTKGIFFENFPFS